MIYYKNNLCTHAINDETYERLYDSLYDRVQSVHLHDCVCNNRNGFILLSVSSKRVSLFFIN